MDEATQKVFTRVYRDATKTELLLETTLHEIGDTFSDERMVELAKEQLQATKGGDVDSYHYEVTRVR